MHPPILTQPTPGRQRHWCIIGSMSNKAARSGQRRSVGHPRSEWQSQPINVGILPNLLGFNIRRAQIALWRDFGRTVGDGAIRPGMFSLMALVEANPGIAQIDLASQLDQDKATIVGLIDTLQKRHWLVRRKSAVDRRRHGIFLTASGKRGLEILKSEMVEHEARFTRLFSAEELTQLVTLLRRIHP
jgi:DNA-binding MarR family transcriptional regulator